jgi:hypothetical protein
VWNNAQPGKYDIIVDVNNNGKYDAATDALDDNDILVTAGFFVVPEYPFGGLLALAACFVGFAAFKKRRTLKFPSANT